MNLNDTTTVVLTAHGKEILDRYKWDQEQVIGQDIEMLFHYDPEGRYSSELWGIMAIFGRHMYNGAKPVFEHNELQLAGTTNKVEINMIGDD